MRLDDHLEQLGRAPQQFVLGVPQLLVTLLLQLGQAVLEELLLIEPMSDLQQDEDVVAF